MEIRVLGDFVVQLAGHRLHLGTPKQRAVLALLTVHAAHLVTVEELIDELWPEVAPPSAGANVRSYAANLRRIFETAGHRILVRQGASYRLDLDPDRIDLRCFETEHRRAQDALRRGDGDLAGRLLTAAVARWHGAMLGGVPLGPALTARVTAAHEERLLATESLAGVRIDAGRPELAIPMLRELIALHPLRESAYLLLMRALYRHGDRAGTIAAFDAARAALRADLGIEPGLALRRLRQAVDAGADTAADRPTPPPAPAVAGLVRGGSRARRTLPPPHAVDRLPRSVTDFVGRDEAVERLLAETRRVEARTSAVHLIDGMAGSGKTTLAVHVARRLADRYPDGQLYLDLCGHGETPALDPSAALVSLLRQLGVPSGRLMSHPDERVELWRRELAARRVVVVLDNAESSAQVLPLLPTAPGSVILVTSRRRLAELDVGPPESLSVMSLPEGLALLAASAGRQRVEEEPEAAAEVVRRCGFLPLAIRLAGSRLALRRTRRMADLARLLAPDAPVLEQLDVGERSLARAFTASYEPLDEAAKQVFRLMSVHAGHHTATTVAAVADLPLATASRVLDELVDHHLVEETAGGRYRFHDLVHRYARNLCRDADAAEVRRAAVVRLLDATLHHLMAAAAELHEVVDVRAEIGLGEPLRPDLLTRSDLPGVEWIEQERENLVLLVRLAADEGLHAYVWRLARLSWRFCHVRGYFDDIRTTHALGLASAEALADRSAIAVMSNYLASALVKTGSYREASRHLDRAVALAREVGDRRRLAQFRGNLVVVAWLRGDLEEAVTIGVESMRERDLYDESVVPLVLTNLGIALTSLGRYDEATRVHRQHLFRARVSGDDYQIANALSHLAAVTTAVGRYDKSIRLLRASLRLFARTGHRYGQAETRNALGVAYRGLGRLDEARRQHELALELAADSGEVHAQCSALNDLGRTLSVRDAGEQVVEAHRRALELATRFAHPYEQARALAGLAEHHARTDPVEARRHWERALAIFRRTGVPERFEAERRLAELAPPPEPGPPSAGGRRTAR
ncbi:AfsR/SARP family transcriptional regulator [Micromonospora sp. URMC 103]|uniref:AfsR/SARP family transcriptional regulator n=1 Tax=Micromonospora sp. URMC 103 TaxID=3423406 RepID=UPI003F1AE02C